MKVYDHCSSSQVSPGIAALNIHKI